MDPTHDPLRFAAREHLRRHLTSVLDAVDMPEPTRTAVVAELLDRADVHCEDRAKPTTVDGGRVLLLEHHAVMTIRSPWASHIEKAEVAS